MASTEDKAASKENKSSWKDSIYNPRTGELLGRTASSWGKEGATMQGPSLQSHVLCLSLPYLKCAQSVLHVCAWMLQMTVMQIRH